MDKTDEKLKKLQDAILSNDFEEAQSLFGNGVQIKNHMIIDEIARKRNCVPMLKLVEKHRYDLTQRGHIVLFQAVLATKLKNVQFLIPKLEGKDTRVAKLSILNLPTAYIKSAEKVKPIVDLIVPHLTEDALNGVLDLLKTNKPAKGYTEYVLNSWLQANLTQKNVFQSKKVKI